jgi:TM2 domain-containing membrane protein YozV
MWAGSERWVFLGLIVFFAALAYLARRGRDAREEEGAMADEARFCHACGRQIEARSSFCVHCGAAQSPASLTPVARAGAPIAPLPRRSKLAAAMLAFFLGGIGLHRFYLGRPLSGVVYLLLCWTGIPLLLGFIEALVLLTMSEERFAALYP